MKYTRDLNGVIRISKAKHYVPGLRIGEAVAMGGNVKRTECEDTRIRKDIYKTITDMIRQKKSDIEIEILLTNKYPSYGQLIRQIIIDQFKKFGLPKSIETKDGDER